MHRCLRVPELLSLIFSYLREEGSHYSYFDFRLEDGMTSTDRNFKLLVPDRRTLAALARTCRNFFDPAADVLWGETCCFAFLMSVVPNSELTHVRGHLSVKLTTKRLTDDDMARISRYSHRIKTMDLINGPRVTGDVYQALYARQSRRSEQLLPRLRSLILPPAPRNQCQRKLVPLLCSPSLENITYIWMDDDQLLDSITARGCQIKSIYVRLDDMSPTASDVAAQFVENCSKLEEFISPSYFLGMQPKMFRQLALLPNLRSLTVRPKDNSGPLEFAGGFGSLRHLRLRISRGKFDLEHFFGTDNNWPNGVTRLHLDVHCYPEPFCLLPSLRGYFSFLTELTLQYEGFYSPRNDSRVYPGVLWRTTQPFACLAHLTIIDIHVVLQDKDMRDLSKICPSAETMDLRSNFSDDALVTHAGITALIESCPKLHTLKVGWDASNVLAHMDVGDLAFNKRLVTHVCYGSPILLSPKDVAAFLLRVMPNMKTVSCIYALPEARDGWKEVQAILNHYRDQEDRSTSSGQ